jgi:hypothetical protein
VLFEGARLWDVAGAGDVFSTANEFAHSPGYSLEFASVRVEADSLYVEDGNVWTSGGVTSGIDMSLAMVEADHGRWLAARVARELILTARRVGNQAQYSVELKAQAGRYAPVLYSFDRASRIRRSRTRPHGPFACSSWAGARSPGGFQSLHSSRVSTQTPVGADPDGATIDPDGCLRSAHWGAGCIVRYTPAGEVGSQGPRESECQC